jgi:hypothetical protein
VPIIPIRATHNAFGGGLVNFQVTRRTHSSLLKELDLDPHVRAERTLEKAIGASWILLDFTLSSILLSD